MPHESAASLVKSLPSAHLSSEMEPEEPSSSDLEILVEWGWQKDGKNYVGEYKTDFGSWRGIIRPENGEWQFYILNCPAQVSHGRHAGCFRPRSDFAGKSQHWIHFHGRISNIISGILAISQVIREDFTGSHSANN